MNKFAKLIAVTGTAVGLAVLFGPWTPAHARDFTDHALFDGTNAAGRDANGETGVLCGFARQGALKIGKSWVFYVSVTNFDVVDRQIKVLFSGVPPDEVTYKIPVGESFSFSHAAGGGEFDAALRVVADINVAGWGSAAGQGKGAFCLSCDENADMDAVCDFIIPTP